MIPARITTGSQVFKNIYGEEGLGPRAVRSAMMGRVQHI